LRSGFFSSFPPCSAPIIDPPAGSRIGKLADPPVENYGSGSGSTPMLFGFAAHMLRRRKEAAVHHWMGLIDWASMGAAMLLWIVLIAVVGYAAVLVAWRKHA
jgi:hypothetical protein